MNTLEFFQTLYPDPPAHGLVSIFSKNSKCAAHVPVSELYNAAEFAEAISSRKSEAYYGAALRFGDLTKHQRGRKAECLGIPGFWVDIDIQGPGHAAQNLPVDFVEAISILEGVVPDPTLVISTGGGLHCYWLFDTFWTFGVGDVHTANAFSRRFQSVLINAGKAKGFHIDNTADVPRMLRIVGTNNNKDPENPRPVENLFPIGPRYDRWQLIRDLRLLSVSISDEISPLPASAAAAKPDVVHAIQSLAYLENVRRRLLKLRNLHNRTLMAKVLGGDIFAAEGARDETLQRIASIVAYCVSDPENADPEVLAELIRPSLNAMAKVSEDAPTFEDAVDKIERALLDKCRDDKKELSFRDAFKNVSFSAPSGNVPTDVSHIPDAKTEGVGFFPDDAQNVPPYTKEDLNRWADELGVTTPEEFAKRWIIQSGSAYYIFRSGKYQYPVHKDCVLTKARDDLRPAEEAGVVTLWKTNAKGESKRMNLQELMDTYGTVTRQIKGSMQLLKSEYDASKETFIEAMCPLRHIEPIYDQRVQTWLECLGGKQQDKLLDWIATVTMLTHQTSALYLSGHAGAGKTLLANGLARFWTSTGGPTELEDVHGSFNSGIANCPLIFGDEDATCSTADLRRLIGSSSYTLRRKFLPNIEIDGCLRLILADNNGRMLDGKGLIDQDVPAVATKFLHIVVDENPVNYLKSLGGRTGTADWVVGDRIASHAVWLQQNRQPAPGGRFVVEGDAGDLSKRLLIQGSSLVCEWIVHFIIKPIANVFQLGFAMFGEGRVLIAVDAFYGHWSDFILSDPLVSRTKIATALVNISAGTETIDEKIFHVVDPEYLYAWMKQHGIGNPAKVRAQIEGPLRKK